MTQDAPFLTRNTHRSFDTQVDRYDQYAVVQHLSARRLADVMRGYQSEIDGLTIIEMGAGTGLVTKHLLELFPESDVIATDLSSNMIQALGENLSRYDQLMCLTHDANESHLLMPSAHVAVSAFTLQWLDDPVDSVVKWAGSMCRPSWLFLSWPGEGSFAEWRQMAEHSGLSFTGNLLPPGSIVDEIASRVSAQVRYHSVESIELTYPRAIDFFRSIRDIGAGSERASATGPRNLLRLSRVWDRLAGGEVVSTYQVHTAVLYISD